MPTPTSPLPPPPLLAQRYRLERRIAQGGMAEVWLATDMSLSRQVAVKILKSTLATDPVVAERFRREAITVARLSHPNIVAVHDTIDHNGRQAVVMQLINGKSLRQLLDEQKRLSPELTIHIGQCVAAALDAAHTAGLVHRDVKPGNILITPDARILLADFGIAKGLGSVDDLTSENVMMGTAKYLSPEQVRGRKLDGRADLYALGLVLYECLAGKVPFLGESDADTALARLQRDPTDLSRLRATLPYGLVELIHELLARNPEDRPTTGAELRSRLTHIASGVDDRTTTITPPRGTAILGTTATPSPAANGAGAAATPPPASAAGPVGAAASTGSSVSSSGRIVRPGSPSGGTPRAAGRMQVPADRHAAPTPRSGSARPIKAPPPVRDRTPTAGHSRAAPARQFQQKRAPSIIVITLLLLAVIVGAVIWTTGDSGDRGTFSPATTPAADIVTTVPATASGPASIVAVTGYKPTDPEGADEAGNVPLAHDGDASTAWRTSCYNNKYFNGHTIGLVVQLSANSLGSVTVAVDSAPYQLQVYTSSDATIPAELAGWGSPAAPKNFADTAETVTVPLTNGPATFVLLLLIEAGRDSGCSAERPYRGAIGEVSFTPA